MASHGQFKWFGTMIVIYTNILFAHGLAIVMEKLFSLYIPKQIGIVFKILILIRGMNTSALKVGYIWINLLLLGCRILFAC